MFHMKQVVKEQVKIGDKVTERAETIGRTLTGVVVYIHPEGRYYTVEFKNGEGHFRESFVGQGRKGDR